MTETSPAWMVSRLLTYICHSLSHCALELCAMYRVPGVIPKACHYKRRLKRFTNYVQQCF